MAILNSDLITEYCFDSSNNAISLTRDVTFGLEHSIEGFFSPQDNKAVTVHTKAVLVNNFINLVFKRTKINKTSQHIYVDSIPFISLSIKLRLFMEFLTLEEIESNFIDNRNRELWNKLNAHFKISVSNNHDVYRLDYLNKDAFVYLETTKNYSPSLFTHELLHLNLRYRGLNLLECFDRSTSIMAEFMVATIGNCIEHVLFFDEYISLGYDKENFVMDYNNSRYDISQLQFLYNEINSLRNNDLMNLFICYAYWTLKNEEYMGVNRDRDLFWLRESAPSRYDEMEAMFAEVIAFRFESLRVQSDFNRMMAKYLRRSYSDVI